jgi:hypothetical protein
VFHSQRRSQGREPGFSQRVVRAVRAPGMLARAVQGAQRATRPGQGGTYCISPNPGRLFANTRLTLLFTNTVLAGRVQTSAARDGRGAVEGNGMYCAFSKSHLPV